MLRNSIIGAGGNLQSQIIVNLVSASPSIYKDYSGSITMPVGIQQGDVLLMYQVAGYGQGGVYPSTITRYGSGFTSVNAMTGNNIIGASSYYTHVAAVSYKIATGSESGTVVSGFISQAAWNSVAMLFRFRPTTTINNISVNNISTTATTAEPPIYSINSAGTTEIVYYLTAGFTNVISIVTNPTPLSSAYDSSGISYARIAGGVWISNLAGSYTFDANSNLMSLPMGGRLIIT